ncbi:MAG: hypothetical protein ACIAQF_12540 [Phycisphaerales bacterium JB065]
MKHKTMAVAFLSFAVLPLSGCLVSGSGSSKVSGTPVGMMTLETLQEQAMTSAQVIELLGPPTRRTAIENGEIFAYEWEEQRRGKAAVFLLFATSNTTNEKSVAYVQFENGVVTKTWISK